MLSQLAQNTSGEIEKGQHVRQQLTLWDNCLETRIRIQKAVELGNQLPQVDQLINIVDSNDEIRKDTDKVKGELRDVIDDIMELRTSLLNENDAIDLDQASYSSRKRHLDDDDDDAYIKALWNDISQVNDVFVPFRNLTLEKWSNKVQAASSARMDKKFKAFDQNILTQIDNMMSDKQGLLKRTRLQRAEYKILGKGTTEPALLNDEDTADNNTKNPDRYQDTYDEELFDDNDFYQQQLRELIESRMVDTDDPIASGMRWAASKKDQVKKKKKNIDTKGSKGRKLR
ncbi:apoptosis antagonizing transcription factor-domain-containing protein [Absidia repens]|uniref:Protein BFR2 n=1 Tax=Absidia repens TaxID=90262 RepID=A0A1X2IQ44_9FUNG|nr:apoptosis antagonizing transcription factor-domain-containing protein [Absidia repens]